MPRFPIRFGPIYALLSKAALLPPSGAYVELGAEEIEVRMSWAFRARFPRSAVRSVARLDRHPISRGVHGFGGRWLVNGAGDDLVAITLAPEQRAKVLGAPVRLRELWLSLEDPDGVIQALSG